MERMRTHFLGDSCPGGHYEDVSAPPRPRPAEAPETEPDGPPPEPDYAAWLPSDFLSRGWCRGRFQEFTIENRHYPNPLMADKFCMVGAIMAAETAGSLDSRACRRLVRAINNVIRKRPEARLMYVGAGRNSVELWNDMLADAETVLTVLREAERRCGLRDDGGAA